MLTCAAVNRGRAHRSAPAELGDNGFDWLRGAS